MCAAAASCQRSRRSGKQRWLRTSTSRLQQRSQQMLRALLLCAAAADQANNKKGVTTLHLAGSEGHSKFTQALLNGNATVDAVNDNGQTPLCGSPAEPTALRSRSYSCKLAHRATFRPPTVALHWTWRTRRGYTAITKQLCRRAPPRSPHHRCSPSDPVSGGKGGGRAGGGGCCTSPAGRGGGDGGGLEAAGGEEEVEQEGQVQASRSSPSASRGGRQRHAARRRAGRQHRRGLPRAMRAPRLWPQPTRRCVLRWEPCSTRPSQPRLTSTVAWQVRACWKR
mmetsp:Transcript_38256/g.105574  ORF Transcript_38256/g.105574 Transcript_38256/m.105574 type:complete len:281 (+) Transcript_38256:244-1086(+)